MSVCENNSPYYPPRARWYSPLFSLWNQFCLSLRLNRLHLPFHVTPRNLALSTLVPGGSYWATGMHLVARAILMSYCACFLVFLIFVGQKISNYAFGAMVSLHVTSLLHFITRNSESMGLFKRIFFTLVCLLALGLGVYLPVRDWTLAHVVMPIHVHGRLILLRPDASPAQVKTGEMIAYKIEASGHYGVWINAGIGFDPVSAVAGDSIRFSTSGASIGQRLIPHREGMPLEGEWTVPEGHWMVWPTLQTQVNRGVNRTTVEAAFQRVAFVNQSHYIGRPYHHWFGRSQELP